MCSVRFNKQLLRTRLNKLLYILNKIQVKKYKGRGGSTQTIDSPQIPRKSRKVHGTEVFDFVIIAACVGFYLQHWEFVKSCKLELREVGTLADILTHPLQRISYSQSQGLYEIGTWTDVCSRTGPFDIYS